jgi:predicted permease
MTRDRARRWYRLLLGLLPRELRLSFGADMEQLFADRWAELEGNPGARGRLWAAAVADVLSHAARERGERARDRVICLLGEIKRLDGWKQDLAFGVRTLIRHPGFAAAAVVTLALGIGANVAIFSVVNGVLLRPLPHPDPERLVVVLSVDTESGSTDRTHDHPDIRLWQEQVAGFRVAGYSSGGGTLTGLGDPEVVPGSRVTDGLLTLLGYEPLMGRDLTRADDVPEGPRVVVVSHRFWSARLGRDPHAVGRSLTVDGEPWEIVGVAPEGFEFPAGTELWEPRRHDVEGCSHGCGVLQAVGRIEPGTTFEAVQAQLDAVSESLASDFPDSHRDEAVRIERLIDTQVADVRVALWVLLGAVGMVLLIACANVANLLLVRGAARAAEVALRGALGASRTRVVRQLLTESFLIAAAAGGLGVGLAVWGTKTLVAFAPESLPRVSEIGVDGGVLAFAAALVVGVTALFGALPALQGTSAGLVGGLGAGARATGRRGTGLSRGLLLGGQVALCLALLLGAGLLLRTLRAITAVDYGYATARVERFRIATPESRYDAARTIRFQETLEERLSALPGVRAVGLAFAVPLAPGRIETGLALLDRPEVPEPDRPSFEVRSATPGFLEGAGLTLLSGRWFTDADRRDADGVAVISEAAARRYYDGLDPIGRQLHASVSWGFDEDPVRTIVGVVGDARFAGATEEPEPAVYIPNAQFAANQVYVVLRLEDGAPSAIPGARSVLRELDADLAVTRVSRIEEEIARDQASTRFYLTLISIFSLIALVLAAVGLYGVVAYAVDRRTREIGVRIALGAGRGDVTALVVRQGVGPALVGLVAGLAFARVGSRALESLLFGVAPFDPTAVAGATALLLAVVLLATFIPATRAARVPPATALRAE